MEFQLSASLPLPPPSPTGVFGRIIFFRLLVNRNPVFNVTFGVYLEVD